MESTQRDLLFWLTRAPIPGLGRCHVPRRLASVTTLGKEEPGGADVPADAVQRVWDRVEALYRTGVHPAIQVCIRRRGVTVLNRSIGHARGNAPDDPPDSRKVLATPDTPFDLFSASKAITAMVIHKLDEKGVLHLEDRVCDYIPEFAKRGKKHITLRHILCHRSGIPNLPPESLDLDLLADPEAIIGLLCDAKLRTRPGRMLAYHAVTGGFVLAEVVRRATGQDIRQVLVREICEPLAFRWMRYGVRAQDADKVALDACTGPPVPPPLSGLLRNALGVDLKRVVEFANDPRWLAGIVPAANIFTNAEEVCAFYQCLLNEGTLDGVRVFEPRTVRHAVMEQSFWEVDLTLGLPLRYSLGFMLGGKRMSLFGRDNAAAFGHLGFTNIITWCDPERRLSAAILTNGKPVIALHVMRLLGLVDEIGTAFPKLEERGE